MDDGAKLTRKMPLSSIPCLRRVSAGEFLRTNLEVEFLAGYHDHRRKRPPSVWIGAVLVGVVLIYTGILLCVQAIGSRLEHRDAVESVGTLDERFTSELLTMEYSGHTWQYRKSDLTNLLLIGVDWEEGEDAEDAENDRYAGQADFLLLVTIDRKNESVSTIQMDRDTIADIRIYGPFGDYTGIQQTQICLSHAYGTGEEENSGNTVWAVSRLLNDIPIDGYLTLDMSSIALINDALGGVTVSLEEDFSALDPQMTAGTTLTLQGVQAEYYVRGRMNVGDGTNAGRMKRQRTFIRAAEELLIQKMNEDADYIGTVYDLLDGHLATNFDRSHLIQRAYECRMYQRPDTEVPAGTHSIGTDGFMEFHVDEDALNALVAEKFFEKT